MNMFQFPVSDIYCPACPENRGSPHLKFTPEKHGKQCQEPLTPQQLNGHSNINNASFTRLQIHSSLTNSLYPNPSFPGKHSQLALPYHRSSLNPLRQRPILWNSYFPSQFPFCGSQNSCNHSDGSICTESRYLYDVYEYAP